MISNYKFLYLLSCVLNLYFVDNVKALNLDTADFNGLYCWRSDPSSGKHFNAIIHLHSKIRYGNHRRMDFGQIYPDDKGNPCTVDNYFNGSFFMKDDKWWIEIPYDKNNAPMELKWGKKVGTKLDCVKSFKITIVIPGTKNSFRTMEYIRLPPPVNEICE